MPLYDDLTLSYPVINFPRSTGHPHQPGEGPVSSVSVIISEIKTSVLWRRTLRGRKMIMEVTVSAGVCWPKSREHFGGRGPPTWQTFLGKELELTNHQLKAAALGRRLPDARREGQSPIM
jgi:hypothetical protein